MRASSHGLKSTPRAHLQRTPLGPAIADRTDLSKLNSALADNPTEVGRSACFDEVNIDLGEL